MKKFLKLTAPIILLILGIIIAIPFIFKDQIKLAVDQEIDKRINAEVYFGDLGLTLFSNFPSLTISLHDFGVIGKGTFEGDTLADIGQFKVVLNLASVMSGDQYEIQKIILDSPTIHGKVLKNGKANWDIYKADSSDVAADETTSDSAATPFALMLEEYQMNDANIIYDDRASDMFFEINHLNHSGNGNLTENIFEFETKTEAATITVRMEGTTYLNRAAIDIELNVLVDQENEKYTLKENSFGLNSLVLNLDGTIDMDGDDILLDLSYATNQNKFKNILSMVPGMYTEDFSDLETDGTFALSGNVKGTYNENTLPGMAINLMVKDGYFRYPDLPSAVSNINFDMQARIPNGDIDKLTVKFPSLHAEFGNNPIDGKMDLSGLTSDNMQIDGQIKATMNLEELSTMIPMEGQEMKGMLSIDATIKGTYNSVDSTFPAADVKILLSEGFLKSTDFPSAIERMTLDATMTNGDGNPNSTIIKVNKFHSEIDGEAIDITAEVKGVDDPEYSVQLKGNLDLEKLLKIYPMEGTEMGGKITAEIQTSGRLSDVEAERYMNLPTSGNMQITNLYYKDADIPQGVKIATSEMSFTPGKLMLKKYEGSLGKSKVSLNGYLENYLGYALSESEEIRGRMSFFSPLFDVNEWLSADEDADELAEGESEELAIFEVPKGVDFVFNTVISKALYDNLVLTDLTGAIVVKNQEVNFDDLKMTTLGGNFEMDGSYSTQNSEKPSYTMDFALAGLDVQKTFEAFNMVQMMAPAAKFVNGNFNSSFNLSGTLLPDMMPDLTTLTSKGNMKLLKATVSDFKVLDKLAEVTKLADFKTLKLADTKIFFAVKEGRLFVDPYDMKINASNLNVSGSNGLDGSLKYDLKLDIPAGQAGAAVVNALSGLTGNSMEASEKIDISLKLGGTMDNPSITGLESDLVNDLKDEIIDVVKDKIDEVKDEVKDKIDETKKDLEDQAKKEADRLKKEAEEEAARLKKEAENQAKDELLKLKKEADKIMAEANKQAAAIIEAGNLSSTSIRKEGNANADKIEKSAKNAFEKMAKKKAADKLRNETEKKAKQVENEAKSKAQKLMDAAQQKADKLLGK